MKKLAIGVDIGGINTAFGLVDENGDLYAESVISTKKYPYVDDYPAYVRDLCDAMHAMAKSLSFDYELTGIGIGAPNANYHKGTVETPANLWKFRDGDPNPDESRRIFPLASDISNCFGGVKTLITNDANAATIGEMIYGNAKGMKDFIMITLGTGLGSGFVANGEMIYGDDGFAGEFGHIIVERNGRECGCGRRGCLEAYVSATGIKRTAFELMAKMTAPSKLRSIAYDDFDASMVSAAAEQGDPVALEAFRFTGEMLGRVVRNKALNRLRALGGELPLEEDWLALEPDRRPGPAEAVEQAERAELIRALLNGLPPQDRAIFLRHYYYGQTAADIGAALAMPPSTVKVRLHRGRRKLKELLMERGYSCACADD